MGWRTKRERGNRFAVSRHPCRPADWLALINALPDPVLLADARGNLIGWNSSAERLYRWRSVDLVGKHLSSVAPLEGRRRLRELVTRALRGETVSNAGGWRGRPKEDAVPVLFTLGVVPGRDGQPEVLFSLEKDLSRLVPSSASSGPARADLRAITDALPVTIVYVDSDSRVGFASAAVETWFGVAAENAIGSRMVELVGTEAWQALSEDVEAALRGERRTGEHTFSTAGDGRTAQIDCVPHLGPDDRVIGVCIALTDVTEVRSTERELRHRNRHLEILAEATGSLLQCKDPRAFLAWLHRRLRRELDFDVYFHFEAGERRDEQKLVAWSGLAPSSVHSVESCRSGDFLWGTVARTAEAVVIPDVEVSADAGADVLRSMGLRAYACFPLIAGERLIGTLSFGSRQSILLDVETQTLLRALCNHVAEAIALQRAENVMRQSEARFRALVEASAQSIWISSAAGDIEQELLPLEDVHAITAERDLSSCGTSGSSGDRRRSWLECVHPDDREEIASAWQDALESGMPREVECRIPRDSGWNWCSIHAVPVLYERDDRREWVIALRDIDSRKRAEDVLREADRRKDEYLAVLGHEIRNPLAGIVHGLHCLAEIEQGSPRYTWLVSMMMNQSQQLTALLDDLLDFARISRGMIALYTESFSVLSVVSGAIESVRPLLRKKRHSFRSDIEPGVAIRGDRTRVEQIVTNLLSNAAKYTLEEGEITLSIRAERDEAVIVVRDSGIGIPPDVQADIFEPFRQSSGEKYSGGGLGIGLTLVKQLVELHGGTVSVTSEGVGCGSEFTVRLPLAPDVSSGGISPSSAAEDVVEAGALHGLRVLIIDDNEEAAISLSWILSGEGCDVRLAHTGREGLEAAREDEPEAMLIDIKLPDMTGHEIVREVRRDPRLRGALCVAISGFGHNEAREDSIDAGFDEHLAKPADPERLLALLATRARARPAE